MNGGFSDYQMAKIMAKFVLYEFSDGLYGQAQEGGPKNIFH